jgi:hypothetical protein
MRTQSLTIKQQDFLLWVQRNFEFLKHKGFHPPIQSYPHWLYEILNTGEYSDDDKGYIDYTIKYMKGIGLVTYNKEWTWDKNGAELDWLNNLKVAGKDGNGNKFYNQPGANRWYGTLY